MAIIGSRIIDGRICGLVFREEELVRVDIV